MASLNDVADERLALPVGNSGMPMQGAAECDEFFSFQGRVGGAIAMKTVFVVLISVMPIALPLSGLSAHATQAEANAVSCSRLNVNGTKPGELTVSVNGTTVGTFHGEAGVYQDLETRMRPGINRIRLSFAAPGESGPFGTSAELRCLAPGVATSRDTILSLQPTAKRLSAEIDVNHVPR